MLLLRKRKRTLEKWPSGITMKDLSAVNVLQALSEGSLVHENQQRQPGFKSFGVGGKLGAAKTNKSPCFTAFVGGT